MLFLFTSYTFYYYFCSFHEIGLYDIPAMVDFVLKQSGSKQLQFVGHSMGTSAFLVMCSMRPLYNSKIQTAVLLSPVAFKAVSNLSALPRIIIRESSSIRVSTFKRHCIFIDLKLKFNIGFLNSLHVLSSKVFCKALKMCAAICKKRLQLVHSSMARSPARTMLE